MVCWRLVIKCLLSCSILLWISRLLQPRFFCNYRTHHLFCSIFMTSVFVDDYIEITTIGALRPPFSCHLFLTLLLMPNLTNIQDESLKGPLFISVFISISVWPSLAFLHYNRACYQNII